MECDSCNSSYGYKEIDGIMLCYECFETAYPDKGKRADGREWEDFGKDEWFKLEK